VNKVSRWFWSFLIALPIALLLTFPSLWRCLTVEFSGDFVAVMSQQRTVYISREATPRQRELLLRHLQVATHRVSQFWGTSAGRAVLIYCPTQAQYARYCSGGEGAGCSLGLPWGQSFLVLGPEGNSPDVMAHELCHDELFARLGWFTIKRQVPQWFNEGLALMVDYRFSAPVGAEANGAAVRFLEYDAEWNYRRRQLAGRGTLPAPPLTSLETTHDFFQGNYSQVLLAYLTAGREVARWFATEKPGALARLIQQMADGKSFKEAYGTAGQRGHKSPKEPVKQIHS
jgi:hypothetical protein